MSARKKCFRITCAICSQEFFTELKRILPSLPTFSVTAASTRPEFISFPPEQNTAAVWKICTSYYEKSRPNRRQKHNPHYVVFRVIKNLSQTEQVKKEYSKASLLRIVEKDKRKRLYCHVRFSTILSFPYFLWLKCFTNHPYYDIIRYVKLRLLYPKAKFNAT